MTAVLPILQNAPFDQSAITAMAHALTLWSRMAAQIASLRAAMGPYSQRAKDLPSAGFVHRRLSESR